MNNDLLELLIILLVIILLFGAIYRGVKNESGINNLVCKQLYSKVTDYEQCSSRNLIQNIKLIKELK